MALSRMSTEIGRVLGQRYRIVTPIGLGASAQVFLADDARLRRRVAVKMLHAALADDADFLRRFRAEARAAAALSHPNVVAVFDWGDEEVAFIVTEFLAGGSLRALLDGGALLTPGQALLVGLEAARALDYAHRRGFVHRDIKPANLLFGEEGRLRVADFGLARALAEAAWTEPQGAMLGTARYASPELATGQQLTGRSDVYSLALVLIEAVTGRVPFSADTMIGTLMARVDRPLEVPDELGPLRPVLERAGVSDPALRIDAKTMASGLLAAARGLARPDPLPLAGALPRDGVPAVDDDPTMHGPTHDDGHRDESDVVDLRDDDLDLEPPDWVSSAEPAVAFGRTATDPPGDVVVAPEPAPDLAATAPDDDAATAPDDDAETVIDDHAGRDQRQPRPRVWMALAAVLLIGGVTGVLFRGAPTGPTHVIPDLRGQTLPAAAVRVKRFLWPVVSILGREDGSKPGSILRTEPAAGSALQEGDKLTVVISEGNTLATVPDDLVGQPASKVEARLRKLGLIPRTTSRFDEKVPRQQVIGLAAGSPARLPKQQVIGLIVSEGAKPRIVPAGLAGLSPAAARQKLSAVQLKATEAKGFSETVPRGRIASTRPGGGSKAPRGSTVTLYVSQGPAPRTVPDLRTRAASAARSALIALKLVPTSTTDFSKTVPAGQVISSQPAAGASVRRGATVSLLVSKGPDLVPVPSMGSVTSIDGAIAVLRNAGLRAGNVSGPASGRPQSTTPRAGRQVLRGSTVDINLG